MGINIFPSGGVKFDKTAMTPFQNPAAGSVALTTSYQTVYSYTGKGYLDYAFIRGGNVGYNYVKVTVDGVVKFEGTIAQSSGGGAGVFKRELLNLTYNGSSMSIGMPTNYTSGSGAGSDYIGLSSSSTNMNYVDYPYTAAAQFSGRGHIALLQDSIYFNSSILIEVKGAGGAENVPVYYGGGKV